MKRRGFFAALAKAVVVAVACPVLLREAIKAPVAIEPFWIETVCVARWTDTAYDKWIVEVFAANQNFRAFGDI